MGRTINKSMLCFVRVNRQYRYKLCDNVVNSYRRRTFSPKKDPFQNFHGSHHGYTREEEKRAKMDRWSSVELVFVNAVKAMYVFLIMQSGDNNGRFLT